MIHLILIGIVCFIIGRLSSSTFEDGYIQGQEEMKEALTGGEHTK